MNIKLSEISTVKSQLVEANTNIDALGQENKILGGRLDDVATQCELVESNKDAPNETERELAVLRAERQDRDRWLEDERQKIVEAAREFALQQEQTFNNMITNLEHKLTCKDKELQEMESLLHQLQHDLKNIQKEKNALLEAADERDREFEEEKKLWNLGSHSYGKIQQYLSDLNEERQNVSQLKETCSGLELRMKELEDVNSSLQKDLVRIQEEKKLEREDREEDLLNKVDFLRSESTKLEETLQTKESLVLGLIEERTKLAMTVAALEEKLSKSAQVVTGLQQQCDCMKDQVENLREERGRLEQEKEASVRQEKIYLEISVKKVRELEERLRKEVKEKKELSNTVTEITRILEKEQNCLEKKNKELSEMKKFMQLADKENEESIKDKNTKLDELTFAYEVLRNKLDKMEKNFEDKCKELKQVKDQFNQTEKGVKEWKTFANQRRTFATDLKLVHKLEKLSRDKNTASPCTDTAGTGKSSHGSSSSKPSIVNFVKGDFPLSPIAKSLSNMIIKSPTTVTSREAATQEMSSTTTRRTQPQTLSSNESLALEEIATDVHVEANRRGISKPNGTVDTKKRASQQATDTRTAKRRHVSSGSGADRHTTTMGLKTRSAVKKAVQPSFAKDGTENPESTRMPSMRQFSPPELPLSPRKTKSLSIPQDPMSKIPRPGRSRLLRQNNQKMPSASAKKVRSLRQPALGEAAFKPTGDQTECKMQ